MKFQNKIIQGDALEVLQGMDSSFIDLGISSPPYNKGEKQKGWLVKNIKYNKSGDNISEEIYQKTQVKVLNEIFRVTKSGGSFFIIIKLGG